MIVPTGQQNSLSGELRNIQTGWAQLRRRMARHLRSKASSGYPGFLSWDSRLPEEQSSSGHVSRGATKCAIWPMRWARSWIIIDL